jgi:hypothetical protein
LRRLAAPHLQPPSCRERKEGGFVRDAESTLSARVFYSPSSHAPAARRRSLSRCERDSCSPSSSTMGKSGRAKARAGRGSNCGVSWPSTPNPLLPRGGQEERGFVRRDAKSTISARVFYSPSSHAPAARRRSLSRRERESELPLVFDEGEVWPGAARAGRRSNPRRPAALHRQPPSFRGREEGGFARRIQCPAWLAGR